MYIEVIKSKIHRVTVTRANRVETYVIPGEEGSGSIELNGAAAHLFAAGDIVIIMSYAIVTPEEAGTFRPKVIFPDTRTNKLVL